MAIDQSIWNLLFSWMTGTQCMLPEGCTPPLPGVVVYLVLVAAAVLAVWKRDELRQWVSER